MIEIELPYLMFGDDFPIIIIDYNIEPLNEEKRIRVLSSQLIDSILENITIENYEWHVKLFFKYSERLLLKYPHRKVELEEANRIFWEKAQYKYKKLKEINK